MTPPLEQIAALDLADRLAAYEEALRKGERPAPSAYCLSYATAQIARVRVGVERPV